MEVQERAIAPKKQTTTATKSEGSAPLSREEFGQRTRSCTSAVISNAYSA